MNEPQRDWDDMTPFEKARAKVLIAVFIVGGIVAGTYAFAGFMGWRNPFTGHEIPQLEPHDPMYYK